MVDLVYLSKFAIWDLTAVANVFVELLLDVVDDGDDDDASVAYLVNLVDFSSDHCQLPHKKTHIILHSIFDQPLN